MESLLNADLFRRFHPSRPAPARLPAWVTSQLSARGDCARACGRPAEVHVTWASSGKAERLCCACWDRDTAALAAAGDRENPS